MPSFHLRVPGEPKGQPRTNAFARKLNDGRIVARVYTPGTADHWKSMIAVEAKNVGLAGAMLQGPTQLSVRCFFGRPKSHFRTGKFSGILKPDAPIAFEVTPDFDNLEKAVADCLTTTGAWPNDKQVVSSKCLKLYVDPEVCLHPYTLIFVKTLTREDLTKLMFTP